MVVYKLYHLSYPLLHDMKNLGSGNDWSNLVGKQHIHFNDVCEVSRHACKAWMLNAYHHHGDLL